MRPEKNDIPVVKGFCHGCKFIFFCNFCNDFHSHGIDGVFNERFTKRGVTSDYGFVHRVAHCHHKDETPYAENGYRLVLFTKAELKKMKRMIEESLAARGA